MYTIQLTWKAVNLKGLSDLKVPLSSSHHSGLNSSASSSHMNFIRPIGKGWYATISPLFTLYPSGNVSSEKQIFASWVKTSTRFKTISVVWWKIRTHQEKHDSQWKILCSRFKVTSVDNGIKYRSLIILNVQLTSLDF